MLTCLFVWIRIVTTSIRVIKTEVLKNVYLVINERLKPKVRLTNKTQLGNVAIFPVIFNPNSKLRGGYKTI